ncbi:MAG TPA: transglycosylase SLT domain-containing protein [Vicinamibacteria bacterium]|nr:transglycosylase SLT domain-containing protein [Vicinamibacteria bacterium]
MRAIALSLLAVAGLEILAAAPAEAQVYLRRNADGVLEATDSPETSEFRLRFSAKGVLIHSRGFRSRARPEFDPYIEDAAGKFGVSSDLIRAIIRVESSFDEYAVSSKGAKGLMQLMPATARRFGVSNPFDPAQAIMGGTEYLAYLLGLFRGNIDLAAAGYNAGENAVLRYGGVPPYKETRNYVVRVNAALGSAPVVMSASSETRSPRTAGSASTTLGFSGSLPPSLQPTNGRPKAVAPARPARPLVRVPPRLYYRWVDGAGSTHFADSPPSDGSSFRTIRGLP